MSKRQDRRAKRLADKQSAIEAEARKPILCIDCSYGSRRPYYHDRPECAGAEYPPERSKPTK